MLVADERSIDVKARGTFITLCCGSIELRRFFRDARRHIASDRGLHFGAAFARSVGISIGRPRCRFGRFGKRVPFADPVRGDAAL